MGRLEVISSMGLDRDVICPVGVEKGDFSDRGRLGPDLPCTGRLEVISSIGVEWDLSSLGRPESYFCRKKQNYENSFRFN